MYVDYIDKSNYKNYIGKKVSVKGDVNLVNLQLKELPIIFEEVGGNFNCFSNQLTSLEGAPKEVGGNFKCADNKKKFNDDDVEEVCEVSGKIYV